MIRVAICAIAAVAYIAWLAVYVAPCMPCDGFGDTNFQRAIFRAAFY